MAALPPPAAAGAAISAVPPRWSDVPPAPRAAAAGAARTWTTIFRSKATTDARTAPETLSREGGGQGGGGARPLCRLRRHLPHFAGESVPLRPALPPTKLLCSLPPLCHPDPIALQRRAPAPDGA